MESESGVFRGASYRQFIRAFESVFFAQVLLSLLLFLPSALIMEFDAADGAFFLLNVILVVIAVFLAFAGRLGSFKGVGSAKHPVYGFVAAISMIGFIAVNFFEFFRVLIAGTHQILYTEGGVRFWLIPFKIIAFPAYFLAISRLMFADDLSKEKLAIATVLSILLTGSRGLVLFGLIAVFLYRFGLEQLLRLRTFVFALSLIVTFLVIGYVREPFEIGPTAYLVLVVGSLSQFAAASLDIDKCTIDSGLVLKQFAYIFAGIINDGRVTYWLTECVSPGATDEGYGVASSIVGEAKILSLEHWVLVYAAVISINSILIAGLLRSRRPTLRAIGCAWLPFVLYSIRTEIVYPYVILIKIAAAFCSLTLLQLFLRASLRRHN
jgi:hypothetical protein